MSSDTISETEEICEKGQVLIWGLKMPHLPHFEHNKNCFQKEAPSLFCAHWTLMSCKKSEKKSGANP